MCVGKGKENGVCKVGVRDYVGEVSREMLFEILKVLEEI